MALNEPSAEHRPPRHASSPTFYVSGVHSGPNPSSGLGIARSLRHAYPTARIVAVDYSTASSGLHSEVFDATWVQRPWRELDLALHLRAIDALLAGGAAWFSAQDVEVRWLADSLANPARALIPTSRSLDAVAKPAIAAARLLAPVRVPDHMSLRSADWDLHAFCRNHGWNVWVKGRFHDALRVRDWRSFCQARAAMAATWGPDDLFVQRHADGAGESIALAAYQGALLGAVHLRKHQQTVEGKTWSGTVTPVAPTMMELLREMVAGLEWTGGAELEFIRGADSTAHLIDWNPRFPAWIHAATLAGHNLPGHLAEAAGHGPIRPAPRQSAQFTRVVLEIPVRPGQSLPEVALPTEQWSAGDKHPSGMIQLAARLAGVPALSRERRVPAPDVPRHLGDDIDGARVDGRPTPRRILLPRVAHERFAQVERSVARMQGAQAELKFAYSVKTNPHPVLLALALETGMLAEVISAAEWRRAVDAGFPVNRIVLNGPAQRWGEVAGAPAERSADPLFAAFADSPQSLAGWLTAGPPQARYLGVRLRPVGISSRFGALLDEPRQFADVVALIKAIPHEQAVGIHFHIASDVLGTERWALVYDDIVHWAGAIEEASGRSVACIDIGGGWFPDDFERTLLPQLPDLLGAAMERLPALEQFLVEPGKALAQPSMALVTSVLEVRRLPGGACEIVVDAAISDLPMAPFFPHRVYTRSEQGVWGALPSGADRVVGRICMEFDILARDVELPSALAVGDRVVIGDAGAYDASMAFPFGGGTSGDACV